MNRQRGMTLVELMVSLAVVMLVIGTATAAYLKLLRTYKTQGRLAESYMANLTGLELLRFDIEMAGFGLPANINGNNYIEAVANGAPNPAPYDPSGLNDAPGNAPRAYVHLNNTGLNGSDVLGIKSSAANINTASKKWSILTNGGSTKQWHDPVMDFADGDRVVVLDTNYQLQKTAAGIWSFDCSGGSPLTYNPVPPAPIDPTSIYYIYGLDIQALRMPFNRVDYFLDNSVAADMPSGCAPGTSILYRSTINQADGTLQRTPLIDCVADFQVAFGLDADVDGNVDTWVQTLGAMTALQIQQQLREVRVFMVYQEGLGDAGKSKDFRFTGALTLGGANGVPQLSIFTPGSTGSTATQVQYRWKILEMDIKPMNLIRTP